MTTRIRIGIRTNGWAPRRCETFAEAEEALHDAILAFLERHRVRFSGGGFKARLRFVDRDRRPYFSVSSKVGASLLVPHRSGALLRDVRAAAKRAARDLEGKARKDKRLSLYTWSATGFRVSVRP